MRFTQALILTAMLLGASRGSAQTASADGIPAGSREVQVWSAIGRSIGPLVHETTVWDAGLRYGWVLTNLHGPGLLRGQFEYGVDAVPLFIVWQPQNTAYGVSFDPFALRWNFQQRGRIMPFARISGGALFTTHATPPGENAVNFTPSAAIGLSVAQGGHRWNVELCYLHISDAGLTSYNPGINLLQLRVGISWFRKPH